MAWCAECRRIAAEARAGTAAAPGTVSQAAMPESSAKRTQTMIRSREKRQAQSTGVAEEPGPAVPRPLLGYLGNGDLDKVPWRRAFPGVALCDLPVSRQGPGRLRLVRLDPGRALPEHSHSGAELTMVLRGSFTDELGRFSIGDVAEMDRHLAHRPTAETFEACICVVAEEAPARLHSLFARLVQPLIGL
jgi:putative transcriptional regulator